jgi:hypothetical protein
MPLFLMLFLTLVIQAIDSDIENYFDAAYDAIMKAKKNVITLFFSTINTILL